MRLQAPANGADRMIGIFVFALPPSAGIQAFQIFLEIPASRNSGFLCNGIFSATLLRLALKFLVKNSRFLGKGIACKILLARRAEVRRADRLIGHSSQSGTDFSRDR
jgi:hypothetical protein